jgi:4-amino-4-deoxy-L-arabinose transferase-like glycosyltransferase
MPSRTLRARLVGGPRRWWPELSLAALAIAVFLGCLGSVDLWGKREQRAAVEAIDTIDHNHWLVAQIQGRPRLEKPPLLRWSIAGLIALSGRRDECVVRLPCAFSALGTVALIYALGRRMGGRAVGLSAGLVLCSFWFFVGEMRQASNDGPLAFFTCFALYAAWCGLQVSGESEPDAFRPNMRSTVHRTRSGRAWRRGFACALGLGFLTKGPIILLLVAVTLVPFLAASRRLIWGLKQLIDGWGLLLFSGMALGWPLAVLSQDPRALRVWSLEMSEKTGLSSVLEHRHHIVLLAQWPAMVLPWTVVAVVAAFWPVIAVTFNPRRRLAGLCRAGEQGLSAHWLAWWWAVGNLAVFCLWAVAKPSYYIPCMPGMALLTGLAWIGLGRTARGRGVPALAARWILQLQWVSIFTGALVAPVVIRGWLPAAVWPWSVAIALALASGVGMSMHIWKRGALALALAPVTTACAVGVLIVYGTMAPTENGQRSHRELAQRLAKAVSRSVHKLMFFNQIDEGLWFYLRDLELAPVPGSHPRYNSAYDLAESYRRARRPVETLSDLEAKRLVREKQALLDWLDDSAPSNSYVLLRNQVYDRYADELGARVQAVFREAGLKRNELTLLRAAGSRQSAAITATIAPSRR